MPSVISDTTGLNVCVTIEWIRHTMKVLQQWCWYNGIALIITGLIVVYLYVLL